MKQKMLGLLVGLFLLSACGQTPPAPVSQNTSTPTFTPSPFPTATITNTPTPTETLTPTPTETPGPYWEMGQFGDFPHAVNDNGQEVFNFLLPFEEWLHLPDLKPATIKAYHEALLNVKLSDGTPLVKPMNTPEYLSLPPLNWKFNDTPYGDQLAIGHDNVGDPVNAPRTRYLGGAFFQFPGSDNLPFSMKVVAVTMQVEDRSKPEGYSLWTGFFSHYALSGMVSGRIPALFNNRSQFNPYITFDPAAPDPQFLNNIKFLQSESEFDPAAYEQALMDFYHGIPNDYFQTHFIITNIGATRWHAPPTPTTTPAP